MPQPELAAHAGAGSEPSPRISAAPRYPAYGAPLAVLTWNVAWLGDDQNGPGDEARQLALVSEALQLADADVIALQEVSSAASAAMLERALPGHALELASYRQAQKLALLYRRDRLELLERRAVSGLDDAGRPPLELRLRTPDDRELIAIAVHAKAGGDARSHAIRARFAAGLAGYLAQHHAGRDVIVLGDFNDRFTASTVEGLRSPYEPVVAGGAYVAATAVLERGREHSTRWGATVDHIVLSRALAARLIEGSVESLRDELLARHADFFEAASDHAPVALALAL